jgi:hypothetical protein
VGQLADAALGAILRYDVTDFLREQAPGLVTLGLLLGWSMVCLAANVGYCRF